MALPKALPSPRIPDALTAPSLRWGILGTGWIAERFASALRRNTRQVVQSVGSRSLESAQRFATLAGAHTAYGSYAALVADPAVDVVYVATPHNYHYPHARLALEGGKHTLVEKPLALNAAECRALAELAGARQVFCMEALWTLFLPKFDVIRQLLGDGVLGEVHTVLADMGEHFEPGHRILRADLAGGPLLDLGTYPVALATWVLGEPESVLAMGSPLPGGGPEAVNAQTAAMLRTASGQLAALHTTLLDSTPTSAVIAGSAATLAVGGPFYQPGPFTLTGVDGPSLTWDEPLVAHEALYFEAAEVARRIAAGETASPLRTLDDSILTMRVVDQIRSRVGIVFPGEDGGQAPVASSVRVRPSG
jgi:predicted dehydrogenase